MMGTASEVRWGLKATTWIAPLVALISTCVFAYGLCGAKIGWISDDYNEVFGVTAPVPGWRDALLMGGAGHWSPYRLLKYPIEGYLGFWLGPGYSHVLQFATHIVCVLLFYFLLKRLKWSTPASLAAGMLFASFPWMSEAVYWWSAATTIWVTILMLGAAHCLISWQERKESRWLVGYAILAFLSLVMYELWLGGLIFFAVLLWYYRATVRGNEETVKGEHSWAVRANLMRYGLLAAPFIVYGVFFLMAPSSDASERIDLPLSLAPRSLAMIHLRALQWPIDTAWHWTFWNAGTAFDAGPGLICLAIEVAILGLLGYGWALSSPEINLVPERAQLWQSLLLGWSIFAGSRIALVLQGFISRYDTRQNYAASMGVAIALVACLSALLKSKFAGRGLRLASGVAVLGIVLLLGWTSTGIGVHYVTTTGAEAETIREMDSWIATVPQGAAGPTAVVIAGADAISHGTIELSYFNEHDGTWLDYAVKTRCPNCRVFVTDEPECSAQRRMITLQDAVTQVPAGLTASELKNKWWVGPPAVLFRWTGTRLTPESVACQ